MAAAGRRGIRIVRSSAGRGSSRRRVRIARVKRSTDLDSVASSRRRKKAGTRTAAHRATISKMIGPLRKRAPRQEKYVQVV
jgi:hypothetical protein